MNSAPTRPIPSLHLSPRWKQILTAAFLSFGAVVPSAFGKCYTDLSRAMPAPVIAAAVAPANNAVSNVIGPINTGSIVGLWNVTFTSGGETVDVAFDAWHSDGTEILNDYTNPIEGNVCLGVYEQTGPRTYVLKHPSWAFDTSGNLLGTVVIHEIVQLSNDCNSYHGSYKYDVYDTTGAFVVEYTGQVSATRIKPQ